MIELSKKAKAALSRPGVEPTMILDIDEIDEFFCSAEIYGKARIGGGWKIGDGTKIGGVSKIPNQKAYLSMQSSATTKQLSQQLRQAEGGSGSIGSISVELVDKGGEVTRLVGGSVVGELLGRSATIYLGFKGTSHPEDSVRVLSGIISDLEGKPGSWVFKIQHPEAKKKTTLFTPGQAQLTQAVAPDDTTISLDNVDNFPQSIVDVDLYAYVRINDEFIRYDRAIETEDGGFLTNCIRAQIPPDLEYLASAAAAHEIEDDVTSAVRIKGKALDLALRLMISSSKSSLVDAADLLNVGQIDASKRVPNAFLFPYDVKDKLGLVVGDKMRIVDAETPLTHDRLIQSFGQSTFGYYVVCDGEVFPHEIESQLLVSFGSKYSVFDTGCGMLPTQVDIEQHEKLFALYGSSFATYDFYLDEEIEASDLINKECYCPIGGFQLPRSGRASFGLSKPPIADNQTITLNSSNITNPHELKISRSINENFYTTIQYLYSYDVDSGKFRGRLSHNSLNAFAISDENIKALTIESRGLRRSGVDRALLRTMGQRKLDRYSKAAESIKNIKLTLKAGFSVEIGDTVLFGDADLKMADVKNGGREFEPRLMEVQNKKMDLKTGRVTVDLLDTSFASDGRYGTLSPHSYCGTGSTDTEIRIVGDGPLLEQEKWESYINEEIRVYSYDYQTNAVTTLKSFSSDTPNTLVVNPALPFTPTKGFATSGFNISLAPYSDNPKKNRLSKGIHVYLNPSIAITEGISSTQFKVDILDAPSILEGATIKVVNYDYSTETEDVEVTKIEGDLITCEDLTITPDATMTVELVGFKDGGKPYRML